MEETKNNVLTKEESSDEEVIQKKTTDSDQSFESMDSSTSNP